MPLNLTPLTDLLSQLKRVAFVVIQIGLYAGLILIVSDLLIGTKFGVLTRSISALAKIGISGNALTILILVSVGILIYRKNQ